MRSRQARTSASEVSVPASIAGDGFGGAERLHASALRTQAAMSSRVASSCWRPTSWMPTGRPVGPLVKGKRHARHPEIGPQKIERRLAGRRQAERRLARRRRGQDGVEVGEQRVDRARGRSRPACGRRPRSRSRSSAPAASLSFFRLSLSRCGKRRASSAWARGPSKADSDALALGHVAHRRRQLELGDRGACLAELDRGVLHGRQCPRATAPPCDG